jgi:hypothetical protein
VDGEPRSVGARHSSSSFSVLRLLRLLLLLLLLRFLLLLLSSSSFFFSLPYIRSGSVLCAQIVHTVTYRVYTAHPLIHALGVFCCCKDTVSYTVAWLDTSSSYSCRTRMSPLYHAAYIRYVILSRKRQPYIRYLWL